MKITILGTGSSLPTESRHHSATALDIGPEVLLFDCGESTQLQLTKAGISHNKISKIFITHWHGDHVLGLPGLLQTMELSKRTKPIDIYGPAETKKRLKSFIDALSLHTAFKINIAELKPGAVKDRQSIDWRRAPISSSLSMLGNSAKNSRHFNTNKYSIIVAKSAHTRPCLVYSYQEKPKTKVNINYLKKFGLTNNPIIKNLVAGNDIIWCGKKIKAKDATSTVQGKKFVYLLDSAYSRHLEKFAKGADVLLCEATFANDLKESAAEFGHMTAQQAGKLAAKSKSKLLVITHFSPRYKDIAPLLAEAKKEFKNTIAAKDFLEIKF